MNKPTNNPYAIVRGQTTFAGHRLIDLMDSEDDTRRALVTVDGSGFRFQGFTMGRLLTSEYFDNRDLAICAATKWIE